MIPRPQTGNMKKLDQATFQGNNWQLITDNQALKSILKAIGVKDNDYRCVYILTGFGDTVVATSSTSCLEVWAGWHQAPAMVAFLSAFTTGANLALSRDTTDENPI